MVTVTPGRTAPVLSRTRPWMLPVELAPHVEAYRKLADQAASALEGAAVALEQDDLELARTRRNDFDRAAKQEPSLVKTINDVCAR